VSGCAAACTPVIQPRVFVRSQEEEPRVDQSGSPDRFGVSSPAKHLFPYHSPPGSQLRRLRAGRFARLPLGLKRCQCSCGCGWHAMSAPITSVSRCSPRVAADLVRPERHVPSRELVWSRTRGPSLRVVLRSAGIGGLPASASCTEPRRWPSPLLGATGSKPFQVLDGCRQHVAFRFQILNDPVQVHATPPSGAGPRIRAATVSLDGS
jgi:hypothetical protein